MGEIKAGIAREEQKRRNQDRFASTVVIAAAIIAGGSERRGLSPATSARTPSQLACRGRECAL
jgi:hypothetical protein